jgi:hypothetical protein
LTWVFLQKCGEFVEAVGPEALVAVEPRVGSFHRFGAQAAGHCAAALAAGDEAGVGENVEMLHHRRQRHGEGLGQLAD